MRSLYDALVKAHRIDHLFKIGRIVLAECIRKRLATEERAMPLPAPLVARHLAGSFMDLLMWWMEHHYPCSAAEMDRQFHRLIPRLNS